MEPGAPCLLPRGSPHPIVSYVAKTDNRKGDSR